MVRRSRRRQLLVVKKAPNDDRRVPLMLMFAVIALFALTPALPGDLLAANTAARAGLRAVAAIVEASEMQRETV